jgi:hypothetical protein
MMIIYDPQNRHFRWQYEINQDEYVVMDYSRPRWDYEASASAFKADARGKIVEWTTLAQCFNFEEDPLAARKNCEEQLREKGFKLKTPSW